MYILESDTSLVGLLTPQEDIVCELVPNEEITCEIAVPNIPSSEVYPGELIITPSTDDQTLDTKHKYIKGDIVVKEIPTYEVSNENGISFIIAS